MDTEILRERRGKIEILTINRPDARNAIDAAVSNQLGAALEELAADDSIGAVLLTGAGDKAFSAGMDLKAFASGQMEAILGAPGGFGGITRRHFPKPIVAAVNGAALAGGLEIVLSCDLVVAAEHATFGIPEVKRGLIAAAGGLFRLGKRLPLAVALELALTGDAISAQRALQVGLVNRVVAAEQLLDEALALAERIVENAPLAVRMSKDVLLRSLDLAEEDAWQVTDQAAAVVFTSEDAAEGALAFAQKRSPVWKGR